MIVETYFTRSFCKLMSPAIPRIGKCENTLNYGICDFQIMSIPLRIIINF